MFTDLFEKFGTSLAVLKIAFVRDKIGEVVRLLGRPMRETGKTKSADMHAVARKYRDVGGDIFQILLADFNPHFNFKSADVSLRSP